MARSFGLVLSLVVMLVGAAQADPPEPGYPVMLDGKEVVRVYARVGSFSPQERVKAIEQRLDTLVHSPWAPPPFSISEDEGTSLIGAGDTTLMSVTATDARLAGKPRAELAGDALESLEQAVQAARDRRSTTRLAHAVSLTFITVLMALLLIWLAHLFMRRLHWSVNLWDYERGTDFASVLRAWGATLLHGALRLAELVALSLIVFVAIPFVLRQFPQTTAVGVRMRDTFLRPVSRFFSSFVDALPNLLVVVVTFVLAYYLLRGTRALFRSLKLGELRLGTFRPDWAEPTYKLVRVFIVCLAAAVAFPYVPGSKSPAVQGITLFFGVLVSLGATSAVASLVAGTLLTYMGSLQVGDRVRIGEHEGDVLERTLLVTRLRTIKNVVVTIPNSSVLAGQVQNFSTDAQVLGLVLHTTISIGYEASWRHVHELLREAALNTPHILAQPAPFVHTTSLSDSYVVYEINAYTREPALMADTYSELHENIQDVFAKAGVEILSPHYYSLRDGTHSTVPKADDVTPRPSKSNGSHALERKAE